MRILISSHLFAPSVGGIEQVGGILAEEFAALGHDVRVVTQTSAAAAEPARPYAVRRRPAPGELLALVRWCDVFLQNNIGLATLWPALLLNKPVVIAHQTWITRTDGGAGWRERLKRLCLRRAAANVAISRAVAAALPVPCAIIPNPYRDDVFLPDPATPRDRDLIFVGRLVSDKGADILIESLALLRSRGLEPSLTLVGIGPEEAALRRQAAEAGLGERIRFAGLRTGEDLRRELSRHRIMAVPSRWPEPFGIVALEGAACGCAVVGSEGGGLPEAIGPCGTVFRNGSAPALADCLERMLAGFSASTDAAPRARHLALHRRRTVAEAYLELLRPAAKRQARHPGSGERPRTGVRP